MPPRGVKKGSKRARQYEHVKDSQLDRGLLGNGAKTAGNAATNTG